MSVGSAACLSHRAQSPTPGRSLMVKEVGHSRQIDWAAPRLGFPCHCDCRRNYCLMVAVDEQKGLVAQLRQHS
jgi:hypothetical protein